MVTIDQDFVRCDGKSFAIRSITSVEVREQPLVSRGLALVLGLALIVVGLFTLAWFLAAIQMAMEFALQTTDIILLLLFGVGTFFLARWTIKIHKRSRIIVYAVVLATTAGEREAFAGPSSEEARELQRRVEAAIAGEH